MQRRRPPTMRRKREVLALAEQVGAAEAAKQHNLNAATVRSWMLRARRAESAEQDTPTPPETPAEDRAAPTTRPAAGDGGERPHLADPVAAAEARARAAWAAAEEALTAMRRAIGRRSGTDSRSFGTSYGIAIDKAAVIERLVVDLAEKRAVIDAARGEAVASVLAMTLEAVGLDGCPAVRALLADLLRQVGGDAMVADPAKAAEARRQVEAVVGGRLRDRLVGEVEARIAPSWSEPERLALPAAGESESMEVERMANPIKRLTVLRERRRERQGPPEPVKSEQHQSGQPKSEAELAAEREAALHWDDRVWHRGFY